MVDIRAGLLKQDGKLMTADPRKGLLRAYQAPDTLTHVTWSQRHEGGTVGEPEVDVIVFPDEAELRELGKNRRTFQLHFREERSRNIAFWTQEPNASKDAEMLVSFNTVLNGAGGRGCTGPPAAPADTVMADPSPETAAATPSKAEAQSEAAPAAAPAAPLSAEASGSSANPVAAQLAAILSNIAGNGQSSGAATGGLTLQAVMKPEGLLAAVRADPSMCDQLLEFMPEQHRSRQQLTELIESVQLGHQVEMFDAALRTGLVDPVQFGLASCEGRSVAAFLDSIQDLADKEASEQ